WEFDCAKRCNKDLTVVKEDE
ncbi:unnamed protein product, partial [Allacma fusca]